MDDQGKVIAGRSVAEWVAAVESGEKPRGNWLTFTGQQHYRKLPIIGGLCIEVEDHNSYMREGPFWLIQASRPGSSATIEGARAPFPIPEAAQLAAEALLEGSLGWLLEGRRS